MKQSCEISSDIAHAATILKGGGLVAFATETVYGLGANALEAEAVAKIFEAKQRPHFDPLIVHIAEINWLEDLVTFVPEKARALMDHFWPGPLTVVLPKTDRVPDLVTSGLPSVAVRMPSHEQARDLIASAGVPIAAPSANRFGQLSPTEARHVQQQLGDRVDLILDGGPCRVGVESTVVRATDDSCQILRHGGVAQEEIEAIVGNVELADVSERPEAVASPGMLPQHYSPRTRLVILNDDITLPAKGLRVGELCFQEPTGHIASVKIERLSKDGNLREAAANLFAALWRLDTSDINLIVAHQFPNEGLGRAINDRLSRAAD
ncbi:MAG: threonylcarbamoyl-AMP synthase [Planctomycetaceae bacterium]|nr:threonylcarbamoyl-AMP synthase [Planctomycetaceae bacterium]